LESSRCSDSNKEHQAPVVDCTQVPFGNAAAGKRVPVLTCPVRTTYWEIARTLNGSELTNGNNPQPRFVGNKME